MRWEGSAMLRRSSRRTLKAIITQSVALIVALAGSDLKRSVTKQAQSESIELLGRLDSRAQGGSADQKSGGGEVDHRNDEFATHVNLVGSPQVEASNDRGRR
jgi:hypothetical protein